MSNFAVGDRVRIKKDLQPGKFYGRVYFAEQMQYYCGCIKEVTNIDGTRIYLKDCEEWMWHIDMVEHFDPISPSEYYSQVL